MKKVNRILMTILACVLMICMLVLSAACNVTEKDEGHFSQKGNFISKNSKVIGNWQECVLDDELIYSGGQFISPGKPEGYESVYKDEFYIVIEYKEHVGAYEMTINHYWWNLKTKQRICPEPVTVLLELGADYGYEDNQYYYAGGQFYTFYIGQGWLFTLTGSKMTVVSIEDSSKTLSFDRMPSNLSLEVCKEQHLQAGLHDSNLNLNQEGS